MKMNLTRDNKGFSLIEIILAAALFCVFSASALMLLFSSLKANQQANQAQTALACATEGVEAIRAIRDDSFDRLENTNGSGLLFSNGGWDFDSDHDDFGIYRRFISIAPAIRDGNGNVILGEGTEDENMKRVTSTVSWTALSGKEATVELEEYLTRWK
jgi:prepilin-type N-terminal cleavage/methylation domain-containing protein